MREQCEEALRRAAGWLWRSGVFIGEVGSPARGAVYDGYDRRRGQYGSVYHEITGYAVSSALAFARHVGNPGYEGLARQSACYLLPRQITWGRFGNGAFPHGASARGDITDTRCFSFDTGMLIDGLLDLYERCGEDVWLTAARRAGGWLVGEMQREDGSFHAYLEPSTGERPSDSRFFEGNGGCLHAKLAIPLLRLAAATADRRFAHAAEAVLAWAERLQDSDGAFWANEHRRRVFAHAHCYAVEGFLYAAAQGCWPVEAGMRGARWLGLVQARNGAVCRTYKDNLSLRTRLSAAIVPAETTDATAQAVRIWLLARTLGGERQFDACAERAVGFLLSVQRDDPSDRSVHGAFPYGRRTVLGVSRTDPRLFTWCTQFGASALMWLDMSSDSVGPEELCRELF